MRYTLVSGIYLDDVYYEKGKQFTFDGTTVAFDEGPSLLGFADASGDVHVYTAEDCSSEVRLDATAVTNESPVVGATILKVKGMAEGSTEVVIKTSAGTLKMHHPHHCCEWVELVDVCGDPDDLVGGTIVVFEERVGTLAGTTPKATAWVKASAKERLAWREYTFYTIRTTKGDVTLRWGEPDDRDDNRYGEEIVVSFRP